MSYVLHVLAPRLAEFRARYPDIQLSIDMTDALVDLVGSHADVAIRLGQLPDSDMLHRPLGRTAWKLVASPDYLDRKGWPKTPADLAQLEQVRFAVPDHINTLRFVGLAEPRIGAARPDRRQRRSRASDGAGRSGHSAGFPIS